jgi:hypothetical protein
MEPLFHPVISLIATRLDSRRIERHHTHFLAASDGQVLVTAETSHYSTLKEPATFQRLLRLVADSGIDIGRMLRAAGIPPMESAEYGIIRA